MQELKSTTICETLHYSTDVQYCKSVKIVHTGKTPLLQHYTTYRGYLTLKTIKKKREDIESKILTVKMKNPVGKLSRQMPRYAWLQKSNFLFFILSNRNGNYVAAMCCQLYRPSPTPPPPFWTTRSRYEKPVRTRPPQNRAFTLVGFSQSVT